MEKWKEKFLERLPLITNEEVFWEYSNLCGGDDYDGCMSKNGQWQFEQLTKELSKRLIACGFLTEALVV